jgi:hypothetical protein
MNQNLGIDIPKSLHKGRNLTALRDDLVPKLAAGLPTQ